LRLGSQLGSQPERTLPPPPPPPPPDDDDDLPAAGAPHADGSSMVGAAAAAAVAPWPPLCDATGDGPHSTAPPPPSPAACASDGSGNPAAPNSAGVEGLVQEGAESSVDMPRCSCSGMWEPPPPPPPPSIAESCATPWPPPLRLNIS
jgi:hypothetical protein